MRRVAALLVTLASPSALLAQTSPTPGYEDPRIQTITYDQTQPVRIVAFPTGTLTLMLLPGDRIERAVLSDPEAFEVRITGASDSLHIDARRANAAATLVVETPRRRYALNLATGSGLAAAYLIRFVAPTAAPAPTAAVPPEPLKLVGEYRVSGDRALRPTMIGDDGLRTYLEWSEYQSLPAVFGIGISGGEEVVDGYMRDGRFVIDRVYAELVFRVDNESAKARRRTAVDRP